TSANSKGVRRAASHPFMAEWLHRMNQPRLVLRSALCAMGSFLPCAAAILLCLFLPQGACHARAQVAFAQGDSVELDQILFVQAPEQGNTRGAVHESSSDGIVVIWIPEPLQ